jgi:hypothetical protein
MEESQLIQKKVALFKGSNQAKALLLMFDRIFGQQN